MTRTPSLVFTAGRERVWSSLRSRPWVLDIVVGLTTLNWGVQVWLEPTAAIRTSGFAFLTPVLGPVAYFAMLVAVVQLASALLKLRQCRRVVAFVGFCFQVGCVLGVSTVQARIATEGWALADLMIFFGIYL